MSTSHTPGPWIASAYYGGWDCIRAGTHDGQIIAKLDLNEPANAHLIATAPELLAILEEIVATDDAAMRELKAVGFPVEGKTRDLTERARAIIAKAKGAA